MATLQRLLLKTANGRYLLKVLAAHLVAAAILIPLFAVGGDLPWDAYFAFGLVWLTFVTAMAGRLVYRLGLDNSGAMRWCLWLAGSCGLVFGGVLAFAETGFVAGYPPVVLFTTPVLIIGATAVALAVGAAVGAAVNWLLGWLAPRFS